MKKLTEIEKCKIIKKDPSGKKYLSKGGVVALAIASVASSIGVSILGTKLFSKNCNGKSTDYIYDQTIENEINEVEEIQIEPRPNIDNIVVDNVVVNNTELEEVTLEPTFEPVIVTCTYASAKENAKIYSDANIKSDKLGMLIKGESLLFVSQVDDKWSQIIYDGSMGYIQNSQIELNEFEEFPCDEDIPTITENNFLDYFDISNTVTATAKVNVRSEATTESEKLDQLSVGDSLPLLNVYDEWCEVDYNGRVAYVYREYVKESKGYIPKNPMADMVYMTSKTPLYDIETGEVIANISMREVAEVYGKTDDYYLVNCKGNTGYISREHVCSLGDNYVIIDISSQILQVYINDELVIETSIVTGKDSSPTYCGLFDVRTKEENVHWPEFKVTVRYWMPFNRGEGMHDAKWRKKFGGTIYHKDGSHGCVNIPPEVMPEVFEKVDVGTPVLVKK